MTDTRPSVEAMNAIEKALRSSRPGEIVEVPSSYIDAVLMSRGKTHGEFNDSATTAQALKDVMHNSANWRRLDAVKREALEHIATKIARILSGDPNHRDAWTDIQGFARLAEERL